jgi:hypothetical protein
MIGAEVIGATDVATGGEAGEAAATGVCTAGGVDVLGRSMMVLLTAVGTIGVMLGAIGSTGVAGVGGGVAVTVGVTWMEAEEAEDVEEYRSEAGAGDTLTGVGLKRGSLETEAEEGG